MSRWSSQRQRAVAAGWILPALLAGGVAGAQVPAPPAPGRAVGAIHDATLRRGDAYFHLMRAQMALRSGRVIEALRQVRQATALEPDSAPLHAEAAGLLLQLGQRRESETLARRALEIDPDSRAALRVLADLAASEANGPDPDPRLRDEAIRLYGRLAEDPSVDDEVLLMLAQLQLRAGDRARAIEVAGRLADRRPGDPLPVRLLAQSLVMDGQLDRALDVVLDFLSDDGIADDLLLMAERLAKQTAEWDRVEQACARMIQSHPDLADVRRLRGEALIALERPHEAVPELEEAVRLGADSLSVRLDLANGYLLSNRLADAAALAVELSRDYPGTVQSLWVLGEARQGQRDVDGAVEAFSAVLETLTASPSSEPAQRDRWRVRIAGLLLSDERPREALRALERLELPTTREALQVEARAAIAAGDLRRARALARDLADEHPADAAFVGAEAALAEGRIDDARALMAEGVESMGTPGRRWAAELLRRFGHVAEEERVLREWVALEPADAGARFALGALLDRVGRYDESEIEFRRALELRPEFPEVLNYLGYSLADRGVRLDQALVLIRRALELDPWNGAYLDSLGWVYFRMGRYLDAREPLERAAREFPHDPVVLDHLGDLYAVLDEPEAAQRAWLQAIDAGAEDPERIREKVDRVTTEIERSRRRDSGDDGSQANRTSRSR